MTHTRHTARRPAIAQPPDPAVPAGPRRAPGSGGRAGSGGRPESGEPAPALAAADRASGAPEVRAGSAAPRRAVWRAALRSRSGDGDALVPAVRPARAIAVVSALLIVAMLVGTAVGPAGLSIPQVLGALASRLPWHSHPSVSALDSAIVWQIRLPRVVLGVLVGSMLAGGGAAYQGVFRNPLADPYLLGIAAGAGLGATIVVVSGADMALTPLAAFAGAVVAVVLTYAIGAGAGRRGELPSARAGTGSILLAGIAVAALLTAFQTYLQQQHTQALANVYAWILGGLSGATWSQVWLILPYVVVAGVALLTHRRLLDVLQVGEDEATSLGVHVPRVRLAIVAAATLGVAAAVAVSGLIGFVGIIVPHAVRLTAGPSYRVLLPVSMLGGAAFLVLADVVARTAQAPAEVPIGVITALIGAPFFLVVLRSRQGRQDLS